MAVIFAPTLRFDEGPHAYYVGERRLLSVTQALHLSGHVSGEWFTERARLRGTYVHQALEMYQKGELGLDGFGPGLLPYVQAFQRIVDAHGLETDWVEARGGDDTDQIAGTVDWAGTCDGDLAIIDFKTGTQETYHRLQLCPYARFYAAALGVPIHQVRRFGLYLTGDGGAELVPFTDRNDFKVWDACRVNALWRWAIDRRTVKQLEATSCTTSSM